MSFPKAKLRGKPVVTNFVMWAGGPTSEDWIIDVGTAMGSWDYPVGHRAKYAISFGMNKTNTHNNQKWDEWGNNMCSTFRGDPNQRLDGKKENLTTISTEPPFTCYGHHHV